MILMISDYCCFQIYSFHLVILPILEASNLFRLGFLIIGIMGIMHSK